MSAVNRTAMMGLPNEKKWQLYCSQRLQGSNNAGSLNGESDHTRDGSVQSVWTTGGLTNDPQAYVDKVRVLVGMVNEAYYLENADILCSFYAVMKACVFHRLKSYT